MRWSGKVAQDLGWGVGRRGTKFKMISCTKTKKWRRLGIYPCLVRSETKWY